MSKARRETTACIDRVKDSADYAPLRGKLPLEVTSMEMLSETARPSESDVPRLLSVHKQMAHCREKSIELYGQAHAVFVPVLTSDFTQADLDYAKLIRREISWGQYAESTMQRTERLFAGLRDANDQIRLNLQNAHEYELEQRRVAAKAMDDWARKARAAMPVVTTCTWSGSFITCSSI